MASYQLLLIAAFALFSAKKVQLQQLRGCSGQEVQDMADCMTTNFRAEGDMTEDCFRVNLCPRDYYYQTYSGVYDENIGNNGGSNVTTSDDKIGQQFSIFSDTVLDQCLNELRNNAQQLVVACVQKDPQMAGVGFQFPRIDKGEDNQSGGYNYSYGTVQTCNENRLGACLAGREYDGGMCPVMKKCANDLNGKCDVALTTNVLCKCANKTFQEKFDEMKSNFTRCLKPPADWTFTVTAEDKQHLINQEMGKYCMNCFAPKTVCNTEDVFSMFHCVQSTEGNIHQCYRTSNCPMPNENFNENFEPDMKNITNPFDSFNMTLLKTCGLSVQDEVYRQIGACIKTKIPTIDLAQIMSRNRSEDHGGDNQEQYNGQYTNRSAANTFLIPQQGSCNETILNACLAGRKWNADSCEIERDCAHCSTNCDVPNLKTVACTCAQQVINLSTFPTLLTKLTTCMGLTSPPKIDDQMRGLLMNGVLFQFCNCNPGYNPNGPPPAGPPPSAAAPPPPARRLPKNPDKAPAKPQAPPTPSPVAAKFVSLLRGKNNRRR